MYRFRAIAINDAGPSEPGEPSDPVVIDVPGVQIAPYFVQILNDTIALEHEKVNYLSYVTDKHIHNKPCTYMLPHIGFK